MLIFTIHRWAGFRIALLLLLLSGATEASDIRVLALDSASRKPLGDVSVCLGTPANPEQFGGQITDDQGSVVFVDVPHTPVVLTLSKTSYQDLRKTYPAKRFDIVLEVLMHTGGLGPECRISVDNLPDKNDIRLKIDDLSINQNAQATNEPWVTLYSMLEGSASHYRASEHEDFSDSEWLPHSRAVKFRLSEPPGHKIIYFQVRRYSGSLASHVEAVSDVVSVGIVYH